MKRSMTSHTGRSVLVLSVLLLSLGHAAGALAQPSASPFADEPFPVIFYDVSGNEADFARAKAWGATHVHKYGLGQSITRDQSYFDLAAEHGLKVMSDLRGRRIGEPGEEGLLSELSGYVDHFKSHPALGFWYLSDEPELRDIGADQIRPFYEMIKRKTPDVPVAMAHVRSQGWNKYGDVQDILMYDNYPIEGGVFPDGDLERWNRVTRAAIRNARDDGDPILPVLQAINWRVFAGDEEEYRGYPVEELRYPNATEERYMAMTAIANGAPGLSYYSYKRARGVDPQWGGRVLAPVIDEARALTQQTAGREGRQVAQDEDQDLFLTLWEGEEDEETIVMLINARAQAREISVSTDGVLDTGILESWGDTRDAGATLLGGEITIDQAEPWEVFIYRVGAVPEPASMSLLGLGGLAALGRRRRSA